MEFVDFQLHARRLDQKRIEVGVSASPAGRMQSAVAAPLDAHWAESLSLPPDASLAQAAQAGRALCAALLPPPVFALLRASLRHVAGDSGLRIRLCLDESLVDLPWEYLYRPDMPREDSLSGFLLLDANVSLVRQAAQAAAHIVPSAQPQRLLFVGALWPGDEDRWKVKDEYDELAHATRQIRELLSLEFVKGAAPEGIEDALRTEASIFHYSGHTDRIGTRAYLMREADSARESKWLYSEELAPLLATARTRLAVFSACNSGRWPFVRPLLSAGVPALIGAREQVYTVSATAFCAKVYSSLAVGMSLDEAVTYARLHLLELGVAPSDWGCFMVYMPCESAVLFPRPSTPVMRSHQDNARGARSATVSNARDLVAGLKGGAGVGAFLSEVAARGVLILGRFSAERKAVLDAIKQRLEHSPRGYLPILFDFDKPQGRDLVESILSFAGMSRFIIADLTDPKSVPAELQAIVPQFPSVPVQPIIQSPQREYPLFDTLKRRPSVLPTLTYKDASELMELLEDRVIGPAEKRASELRAQV